MPTATITSKGQITIPKEVRDLLHLATGDRINFLVQDDGRVLLQPTAINIADLKGILHRKGMRAVSIEGMHAAIAKRAGAGK
ncbi:MAG: AbrB/MazE/SpoVT family DNA-binding domain-containing protein [Nitrospirae bacterium]|nr:AbrB/MazE/SpoVT family DNA-binding domain-containing protein [Nitrospirota bacterium]MBI3393578.1 AbrB/MazE/SpoVT family DNA-binding domain-containing protein [Nitrospirota bacterium]